MLDVYKNIEDFNPDKKIKLLIVFDDIIADIINYEKLNPIVTDLFIRGRKVNFILFLLQNHILKYQKILY